ncbi:hypothetical protein C0995_011635 [Termitomyces sp. Mi166|nr:hypothetical protein C0995_011635 [Termitomyces sp. Mi166\
MAHAANVPSDSCKAVNSAVAKLHHLSLASTEPVITTPPGNYGLLKHASYCWSDSLSGLARLCYHAKDKDVEMLGPSPTCPTKRKTNSKPDSKPKPKKMKVSPASANHTLGSDAILALLGQVDATLEAISLAKDGLIMPCAELQKHCDAIDLAAQQQLYSLDISLQTFKMIVEHLDHLDKALGPSNMD